MKAIEDSFEEIFEFKGLWDVQSKCGLKRIKKEEKEIVIAFELYKNNPGSSITSASALLVNQIVERFNIQLDSLIYIESNPNMNSKLSFYQEEYYRVFFEVSDNKLINPIWKKLSKDEFFQLVN